MKRSLTPALALALLPVLAWTQAPEKKILDHSVYDSWNAIRGQGLSRDGKWVYYAINPIVGDGVLTVKSIGGSTSYTIPRGS
ncbi:MAG TPA: hypothetical protein VEX38_06280, partial [Fimbriimonadaceae bacterium]|nr:hypothetical protein [Fimbriimonadaceae bacterium]